VSLKLQITDDVKQAMRAKDKPKLSTLRLITAAIKQIEVDERIELSDERIITVLEKMLKQRKDSISQFELAGRDDLKDIEVFEVSIIQTYMPQQFSETEINTLIDQAITDSGASSMKDMGKVMGQLKAKLSGRADMGNVSKIIKSKLNS